MLQKEHIYHSRTTSLPENNVFLDYIAKQSIFTNKNTFSPGYIPPKIIHRDTELNQLSHILAPVLRGYKPSNMFVYGKCGTGKTICTQFVVSQLENTLKITKANQKIKTIYLNCKMKRVADTEYRLLNQILRSFGEDLPDTGLSTDILYRRFFEKVENQCVTLILILDEIDALFRKIGDEFIYNLTRINTELKNSHIMLIGITNDLIFKENLDSRIKSSLSEEEIVFRPYDAVQLRDILSARVREGFVEGSVEVGAINKCAAMAAQEHGDARKALNLLRISGEMTERIGGTTVTEKHVDMAEAKIDMDRVVETVKIQPKHSQFVFASILNLHKKQKQSKKWTDTRIMTGNIYEEYISKCSSHNIKPLTQRRVSDLITELDMLGIITTKVISKGRYGRTREICMAINDSMVEHAESMLLFERI